MVEAGRLEGLPAAYAVLEPTALPRTAQRFFEIKPDRLFAACLSQCGPIPKVAGRSPAAGDKTQSGVGPRQTRGIAAVAARSPREGLPPPDHPCAARNPALRLTKIPLVRMPSGCPEPAGSRARPLTVARRRSCVREHAARFRQEAPRVALRAQLHDEDTECLVVSHAAGREPSENRRMV